MAKLTFWQCAEKLKKKENWTYELRYVHRTRLILGIAIGFLLGFFLFGGN